MDVNEHNNGYYEQEPENNTFQDVIIDVTPDVT